MKYFFPVVRHESIRVLLSLIAEYDLKIEQFDIKTAFLYRDLCEEIYMDIPDRVATHEPGQVCRLQKSLYGLKQASRQWNSKFDNFLKQFNFKSYKTDP